MMTLSLPNYRARALLRAIAGAGLLAGLAACGGGGGSGSPSRSLLADAPGDSRGVVGEALGSVPGVRLVDKNGVGVAGVAVSFRADSGGSVSPARVTTDASGRARPQAWVLGPAAGGQALVATARGAQDRWIGVTADPGQPSRLLSASFTQQATDVGTAVGNPPAVRVTDPFGNPVAGVPVNFEVQQGGGSVTGGEAISGANGLAVLEAWILGPSPGPNALVASAAGVGSVAFSAEGRTLMISVESVQLNQATQNPAGDLPAVAGRPGLLRIVLKADRANIAVPDVRVRLFRNGVQQWERILPARTVGVPTAPLLRLENQTWNIELGAAEVQPGIAVEVLADPQQAVELSGRENTRFPRGAGLAALDVRQVAPLEVTFIRIRASRHDGAVANVSPETVDDYLTSTRRWLPLERVEGTLRAAEFVTDVNLTVENDIRRLLGDIRAIRTAASVSYEYYQGIMPAVRGIAVAGIAYLVDFPSDLSSRVGLAYDRLPDAAGKVAHELGHNMGRRHAPCGTPGALDPNFPYAFGGIGQTGYDIEDGVLRSPGVFSDFMSYCQPRWISDYNYAAILDWRRSDPTAFQPVPGEPDPLADVLGQRGPGILIWGRVGEDGVELNPVFSLEARPVLPEAEGAHAVRGFAADGALLFEVKFAGETVPHASDPSERHFGFFVPLAPAEIARLQRVELVSPYGMTDQASTGEQAAADRPTADRGAVTEDRLADGGLRLRWDTASRPVAMVRDRRSGAVLGIGRSGELHFSAESLAGAVPEVLLSDGVRTAPAFPVQER